MSEIFSSSLHVDCPLFYRAGFLIIFNTPLHWWMLRLHSYVFTTRNAIVNIPVHLSLYLCAIISVRQRWDHWPFAKGSSSESWVVVSCLVSCLLQLGMLLQSFLYFHGIDTSETTGDELFGFLDVTFLFLTMFWKKSQRSFSVAIGKRCWTLATN